MTGPGRRRPIVVVVAGTGTEVGKTWVACELARTLRARGLAVAARKPAQSFSPDDPGPTDAELLAGATGQSPGDVCPAARWYAKAMAPPMAAECLGLASFTVHDLVREVVWPDGADVGLVELAGGVGSPQACDGDGADLVKALAPDLAVLVTSSGLGALSSARLACRALADLAVVVYLNRFNPADEVHVANRRWLSEVDNLVVSAEANDLADALFVGRAR